MRFTAMVKAGRLTPVVIKGRNNKWWLFSRRELARWRAEGMTSKEVMAALNITRGQFDTWLTSGKLARAEDARKCEK